MGDLVGAFVGATVGDSVVGHVQTCLGVGARTRKQNEQKVGHGIQETPSYALQRRSNIC